MQTWVALHRARAEAAEALLAALAAAAEDESKLYAHGERRRPLMLRLADALHLSNAKVGKTTVALELLRSWDSNADGTICKDEFGAAIRAMGVAADGEEIEQVCNGV